MYLPYLSGKNEKKTSNLCAIVDGQARKLTPGIGQRECRDVDIFTLIDVTQRRSSAAVAKAEYMYL